MNSTAPTLERLGLWLADREDEHLEFKEAKTQFDSDRLTRYCVALANEGGGYIVLGVSDKRPRKVVGTRAFRDLSALKRDLSQRVRLRIDATTLEHRDGRVLVITVPPRPIGTPVQYKGAYWMRRGEDLVAMNAEVLKQILDEGQPDFSASDDFEVSLILSGEVQDDRFLSFLEQVGSETLAHFTTDDFLLLNAIHQEAAIDERLRGRLRTLLDVGVIESKGRGRGTKYLLSERFYKLTGKPGAYSRKKGLDTETNKALLFKHIERNQAAGSPLRDLQEVLPAEARKHIQYLLTEMREAELIHARGRTRAARWFPGSGAEPEAGHP